MFALSKSVKSGIDDIRRREVKALVGRPDERKEAGGMLNPGPQPSLAQSNFKHIIIY